MNSALKQDCFSLSELHHSMGDQKFLTNVDTAEQVLLECSQHHYVKSLREVDIPVE